MKKLFRTISRLLPDKVYLKLKFLIKMKKRLNLKEPKTFNEKLQWLKIYDRNRIYTKMVDKYEVKKYVANIIGEEYIIPTLGVYDKFDEIDFNKLPDQFVIKCTHDSRGVIIVKDKNKLDLKSARKKINKSLRTNYYYYGREWPYKNIKPKIIVEPYLEDKKYNELIDYKFFVFSGKVKLLFVATNRQSDGETYFDFFDRDYNHIKLINGHKMNPNLPQIPQKFKEMIKIAEKLSNNIPQIRIDLYEIDGRVYFGEYTFYHWSGFVPFQPKEWDAELGSYIKINN